MNNLAFPETEATQSGFVTLMVGAEHESASPRQKRNNKALALVSLTTSILFSVCMGWFIQLHQNQVFLSIVIALCVCVLLLFFNRTVFVVHRKSNKASVWIVIAYILFYGTLSIWIIPIPFQFVFLSEEIHRVRTTDTAMGHLSAMYLVIESMDYAQKKVLTQYRAVFSCIAFFFSMLGLVIHLFIRKNDTSNFERDLENRRSILQRKLAEKQTEYANLYSIPQPTGSVDDPFFNSEIEPLSEEDLQLKAQSILAEIRHIEYTLQFIL